MLRFAAIALPFWIAAGSLGRADEVDGFGRTVDDARLSARDHVLDRVRERMAACDPPLTAWRPTDADADAWLDGPGRAGASVHVAPLGLQHRWILNVRLPSENEMRRLDRRSRRLMGTAIACAAAIAVLTLAAWATKRIRQTNRVG